MDKQQLEHAMEGVEEAFEGLKYLSDMCNEHIQMVAERDEAMRLLAPSCEQESFLGALRNALQVKVTNTELVDRLFELLEMIADELGFPRTAEDQPRTWNSKSMINAIRALTQAEGEALRFRYALGRILGIEGQRDVLPAVQNLIDLAKVRKPSLAATGGMLEKQLRKSLIDMAGQLSSAPRVARHDNNGGPYVVIADADVNTIAANLALIYNATLDL